MSSEIFNSRAVEPLVCMTSGWHLVGGQYWLFVGITLVAILPEFDGALLDSAGPDHVRNLYLHVFIIFMAFSVLGTFVYPLIVERKLSGVEAVKLSAKAGLANFWPLFGLMLLNGLLSLAGVLLCYLGLLLFLPLSFAAVTRAYVQVFGLGSSNPLGPPPPPAFN